MPTVCEDPRYSHDFDGQLSVNDDLLSDTVLEDSLTDTVLEEPLAPKKVILPPAPVDGASLFDLQRNSCCRPVDWRWHQATLLVQGTRLPSGWVDQHTLEARDFQLLLINASDEDLHAIAKRTTALFDAHLLYRRRDDSLRYEVEARILAREPFDSIAQKCSLTVEAIAAYEQVFFNVLDRLEASGWVTNVVMGPKLHEGLTPADIDVLWKLFGFHGGVYVLDQLIYTKNDSPRPTCAAEVGRFFEAEISATLKQKACIALRTLRVGSQRSFSLILRSFRQLQELEFRRRGKFPQIDVTANLNIFNQQIDEAFGLGAFSKSKANNGLGDNVQCGALGKGNSAVQGHGK